MYEANLKNFPEYIIKPSVLADSERFTIKIAETNEEIERALRLRYEVFNKEQGKGSPEQSVTGMDYDEFDEYCLQLIVIKKGYDKLVGTYRVHIGSIATNAIGFYSCIEYDIQGLDEIAEISMELGRSCVLPEFRKGAAVSLLWSGISELMSRAKLRYLFGCVSLEKYNPAATWALYEHFKNNNMITDIIKAIPKQDYKLETASQEEIQKYLDDIKNTLKAYVPPLFKGYLRLGSKIAGEPLYDYAFKTVDFLILVDTYKVPKRYLRHYKLQDLEL